jgi:molybdopterin-guanine dinucleotide biosynthesis protein A
MVRSDQLCGLVVCGGQSTRMGTDKSQLVYHGKPQSDHVYDMLVPLCSDVMLSCNKDQWARIGDGRNMIQDLSQYENTGPLAALLTAFSHWPQHDLLVIGCDYPFLNGQILTHFLQHIDTESPATAFYNTAERYEPLLAYYKSGCASLLAGCFERGEYALQDFLRTINAGKYYPNDEQVVTSVDTFEQFQEVSLLFAKLK